MRYDENPEYDEVVSLKTNGQLPLLTKPFEELAFESVVHQGLPFYSGNILYQTEIEVEETGLARIIVPCYRGALVEVLLDGKSVGDIVHGPYQVTAAVEKGTHKGSPP